MLGAAHAALLTSDDCFPAGVLTLCYGTAEARPGYIMCLALGHRGSQSSDQGPSDLKADVLYSGPSLHHFMRQEFPASFQPPGFRINLSNKQLSAK